MKVLSISKNLIKEFAKEVNIDAYSFAYELIHNKLTTIFDGFKQKNPYITNYNLYVANETFTGAEFTSSSIDIFIALDAPQLELNYLKLIKNKFKIKAKQFWDNFLINFRLFASKKKKEDIKAKKIKKENKNIQSYNVESIIYDLYYELVSLSFNQTKISYDGKKIMIVGLEEYGVNINLYVVFNNIEDENIMFFYNTNSFKKIIIDFKDRFENIQIKNIETDGKFIEQIKIFNSLFWCLYEKTPNQIFIESLLLDCPNELFNDDVTITTLNLLNYIRNSTIQNKTSICDDSINLFKEPLNTISYETAIKFIELLKIE